MILLFAIGILFLAAAAGLLARAFMISRVRVNSQVRQIEAYGFNATAGADTRPAGGVARAGARIGDLAGRIGRSARGSGWRAAVTTPQLRGAGLYTLTRDEFQGYRVMLTVGLSLLIIFNALLSGAFSIVTVLLIAAASGLAWFAPALLVGTRAQRRMDLVDRALPELIDLLIATIEAGLGFAGSLQLLAERFDGPLGQELRLTLREQAMGLSTERALANMLDRCDTPSVRAFVRAVSQGDQLGVSVGAMMRNLATETRKRRRQSAQEQIQKAPVKLLFPLVLMVFPALLVVLLYPAVHQMLLELGG
jgi:Flp pilus assembly protein TadB